MKQALYGIFEVFMDTIVICSLTGLTLLCSGITLNYGTMGRLPWSRKPWEPSSPRGAVPW